MLGQEPLREVEALFEFGHPVLGCLEILHSFPELVEAGPAAVDPLLALDHHDGDPDRPRDPAGEERPEDDLAEVHATTSRGWRSEGPVGPEDAGATGPSVVPTGPGRFRACIRASRSSPAPSAGAGAAPRGRGSASAHSRRSR